MDMSAIAARLGLSGSRPVVRKAAELRRLCDINFDSSVLGIVSNQRPPFPLPLLSL
jgi:origin recognition complex subunit 6